MGGWGLADLPDQRGRTAIVTGGSSGLGAETVRALANAGARVLLACRDRAKGDAVAAAVRGAVEVRALVTLSSNAHRLGRIRFDDLHGERRYGPWTAYNQSKLANLLFALELQRRLEAAGSPLRSMAAHPGYADTNLQFAGPALARTAVGGPATRFANRFVAQSAAAGALPTLYAATVPDLPGGTYVGPRGPGELRGAPKIVRPRANARDAEVAARLWAVSEELTGVTFPLHAAV